MTLSWSLVLVAALADCPASHAPIAPADLAARIDEVAAIAELGESLRADIGALREDVPCLDGLLPTEAWATLLRATILGDLRLGRPTARTWHALEQAAPGWLDDHPIRGFTPPPPLSVVEWFSVSQDSPAVRLYLDGGPVPERFHLVGWHLLQRWKAGRWQTWWVDGGSLPPGWRGGRAVDREAGRITGGALLGVGAVMVAAAIGGAYAHDLDDWDPRWQRNQALPALEVLGWMGVAAGGGALIGFSIPARRDVARVAMSPAAVGVTW